MGIERLCIVDVYSGRITPESPMVFITVKILDITQKQSLRDVLKNRCSKNPDKMVHSND